MRDRANTMKYRGVPEPEFLVPHRKSASHFADLRNPNLMLLPIFKYHLYRRDTVPSLTTRR